MYFYEAKCVEPINGWNVYCFFYSPWPVRSNKNIRPIPDKLRIIIEDREYWISKIKLLNPFEYFWRKYFRRRNNFYLGYRLNWEREKI